MAGSYHWIRTGASGSGAIFSTPIPDLNVAIPAGGIVKRFQIHDSFLQAEDSGIGYNIIGTAGLSFGVDYLHAPNPTRNLYRSTRQLPLSATSLYDPATLQRVYSAYWGAGDTELQVNQQCSYGKHTDAVGSTVRLSSAFLPPLHLVPGTMDGYYQFTFAVLYNTLP